MTQQLAALAAVLAIVWHEVVKRVSLITPPNAKTISTISAAMPATRSPYSTADAPVFVVSTFHGGSLHDGWS